MLYQLSYASPQNGFQVSKPSRHPGNLTQNSDRSADTLLLRVFHGTD